RQLVQNVRIRTPRTDRRQLAVQIIDRLRHLAVIYFYFFIHILNPPALLLLFSHTFPLCTVFPFYTVTFVPVNLPLIVSTMLFSSFSPNTSIGILFSRQRIDAVRSTAASCLSITSWMDTSSYLTAAGFTFGSLS